MRSNRNRNLDPLEPATEQPLRADPQCIETDLPYPSQPGRAARDRRRVERTSVLLELARAKRELALARERIAKLTCIQGELSSTIHRLTEIAATDALTGLSNRRRFCEELETTFALSVRHQSPLSLIMIDVDRFKSYNDTYGHSAGDQVLCSVAQQLLRSSRNYDVVARYGGEEFAILLPAADSTQAADCAERQRAAVESFGWPLRQVTASFGVATLGPTTRDPTALVGEADRALYHAKRLGRNRVAHHRALDDLAVAVGTIDGLRPGTIQTYIEP